MTARIDAGTYLDNKARRTEAALEDYIANWTSAPTGLLEAVRYSLFAGGKRLRPALALAASEAVSGDDAPAIPVACALEMVHTYSLIHDDLPCMDDADLRRGKPSAHKQFGEALAILSGDTLLTMAFDALADTGDIRIVREVAIAAGVSGMAGGQAIDLDSAGAALSLDELQRLHEMKTGALIRASVRSGALAAGASPEAIDKLTVYGERLGLAFQIADDILDVAGDAAAMGKRVGADAAAEKVTYPALVGLDESRRLAGRAVADAKAAISDLGGRATPLADLADYVVHRTR